jgi:glycosyltransferase involved in cell wall biosynthesis
MRLNWFSPLPPAPSGIADYTSSLLPLLAARAEVVLWTDQPEWDERLEEHARVQRYQWREMPWPEVQRADATIYQLGNNRAHHGAIWQVSRQHGGLVVMHDTKLQHLFHDIYSAPEEEDLQGYLQHMQHYYGPVFPEVLAFWCGHVTAEEMAERYPLSLLGVEKALGVVVHSRPIFEVLKQASQWPVLHLPLPQAVTSRAPDTSNKRGSQPPYRLVIFGHLGKNRRLGPVLQALAQSPVRDCFQLGIYGELQQENEVRSWVHAHGLQGQVAIHGFVPPAVLDEALASAHLAINLRYPSMGEASSSQLRLWDHALPSLVTQADWYAGLPEDAVAFVRPANEVADIQGHLRAFVEDPARFAAMGERGRRVLHACHAPEAYVEALVDFAGHVPRLRGECAAKDLARRLGAEMSAWISPALADAGIDRLSEEIHWLTQECGCP